jgi:putative flippase GtrA
MNKTLVFKSNGNFFVAALKYYLLAGTVLGLNYAIMYVLNLILGVPLWITKPMTDLVLFILSYQVQKHLIFKEKQR